MSSGTQTALRPRRVAEILLPRDEAQEALFPSLGDDLSPGAVSATGRVCILIPRPRSPASGLPDYVRSSFHLAWGLAADGHEVTIVHEPLPAGATGSEWIARASADRRARVLSLPEPQVRNVQGLLGSELTTPYAFYEWLKGQSFDIVHAPDYRGPAFYCLGAKALGMAFPSTHFCITAAQPTLWMAVANSELIDGPQWAVRAFIERRSIELADTVVSPTQYMMRWMRQQGHALPSRRCFVHLPAYVGGSTTARPKNAQVKEVVFLGHLEPRKGLHQFVDAMVRLATTGLRPRRIVFAGAAGKESGAQRFIARKLDGVGLDWGIRADLDGPAVTDYLATGDRLAVVSSEVDNAPLSVLACLHRGLPLLVTDADGLVELIAPEDRAEAVCRFHPGRLADRVGEIFRGRAPVPRPACSIDAAGRCWRDWHGQRVAALRRAPEPAVVPTADRPLVTVCIIHFNRPHLVRQAIDSIRSQEYPRIEVVLVDDGSTDPDVPAVLDSLTPEFESRGWRIVRQENLYLGAARNTAARHATGKYLFFLDDDNVAKPHALATLAGIAERTDADILTSFNDAFCGDAPPSGEESVTPLRIVQIGDDPCFGLFRNGFGDSNALIRREAFMALGGNTEDYGVGKDDQEFFARAVLSGYRLCHVPEALYWARQTPSRLRQLHYSRFSGDLRVARAYGRVLPPAMQSLVLIAQGQHRRLEAWGQLGDAETATKIANRIAGAWNEVRAAGDSMRGFQANHPRLHRMMRRALGWQFVVFASVIALEGRVVRRVGAVLRAVFRRRPVS
jgi:GT2 family glycosyltransferase/glycosyltransferase involved in cell wall biosynthesis